MSMGKWLINEVVEWLQNELTKIPFGLEQVWYSSVLTAINYID